MNLRPLTGQPAPVAQVSAVKSWSQAPGPEHSRTLAEAHVGTWTWAPGCSYPSKTKRPWLWRW